MKPLDNYGKGRKAVITEMLDYIDREMRKIRRLPDTDDTHIRASLSGQTKALAKIRTKLSYKLDNLKEGEELICEYCNEDAKTTCCDDCLQSMVNAVQR